MALSAVPSELLMLIAENLEAKRDISAFSRCNHQLHTQLSDKLHTPRVSGRRFHWRPSSP
jgi:hypothetical protein